MGRWIVILGLTMTHCPDIAAAAPPSSGIPLPKPRPVRRDHPAPAVNAAAAPRADGPVLEANVAAVPAEESPEQAPPADSAPGEAPPDQEQTPAIQAPAIEVPQAPVPSGRAKGDCSGGKRIISAYYGQGRRTASGQPFNPHAMTAAHRTLPFGTRLTVSNPRTGKTVTVVINDRGPFVSGVSLDLSLGAALAIGMRGTGTVCIW